MTTNTKVAVGDVRRHVKHSRLFVVANFVDELRRPTRLNDDQQERAAIMEYEGGASREYAEHYAAFGAPDVKALRIAELKPSGNRGEPFEVSVGRWFESTEAT